MTRSKRITILNIAEEAGVSRQTVSRVLNNKPDVAPETRERVLKIIQRTGYQPSRLARSLSQGTSCTLGVVGYGIEYYGPSRTLSVVEKQAGELGYSLSLNLIHDPEDEDILRIFYDLVSQHVDGIIWTVPQIGENREGLLDAICKITIPVVCVNAIPHKSFSLVESNNVEGGKLAADHLISLGRKKIGIITGPLSWIASVQRFESWQTSLNSAGLPCDENLVSEGDWSAESGYHGLSRLIISNPELDAVFACNDQMALGAMKAAAEHGKKIPDEIALVGYDNIPESEFFPSPLTTVRQNFTEQGKKIVEEIERRIRARNEGEEDVPSIELLQPELIIRASSRKTF
jgi:LacI family transcriptional regulator